MVIFHSYVSLSEGSDEPPKMGDVRKNQKSEKTPLFLKLDVLEAASHKCKPIFLSHSSNWGYSIGLPGLMLVKQQDPPSPILP